MASELTSQDAQRPQPALPDVISQIAPLRARTRDWRRAGETIALVPTMGALHDGHLSLVEQAKAEAKRTVVSIFVNPRQFAPQEDFSTYPRTFETDVEKLAALGVDVVWAPVAEVMYPNGFATTVSTGGPALGLETDFRPDFFAGVATVCCKLFCQVLPDVAVFGEKDYQQLLVVRQMARDLNLPLEILGVETVRESDGLAMSSRNAYLSAGERETAAQLNKVLCDIANDVGAGKDVAGTLANAREKLIAAGFAKVDYVELRDGETLAPYDPVAGRTGRILGAAWLGSTRLIDNIAYRADVRG